MDLIPPVVQAIAAAAYMVGLGVAVMYVAVALARISVDFFKG